MSLALSSDHLCVTILPKGAEICSVKNKNGLEFIWQADKNVWPRHAPVLFPIVGKLKDNGFLFDRKAYELTQHGFARDCDFVLIEKNKSSCIFELSSDFQTKAFFPFDFRFRISYTLEDSKLTTEYEVMNPMESTLYFSVGAHPGFRCPLEKNETFEDYYLEFDGADFELSCLSDGLRDNTTKILKLNNNRISLSAELFDNDALVFENRQIHSISLCSSKSDHKIKLQCKDWPYFGVWSKKSCRDFICLEPWYGIADRIDHNKEFTQKDGIMSLGAKESFTCAFDLHFE